MKNHYERHSANIQLLFLMLSIKLFILHTRKCVNLMLVRFTYKIMLLTLMKDYIGPNGSAVPAQVKDSGSQSYKIEFCPKVVGEHKIAVSYLRTPVAGSPFSCKVYDIKAIKVKSVPKGTVGQQVTFIGKCFMFYVHLLFENGEPNINPFGES